MIHRFRYWLGEKLYMLVELVEPSHGTPSSWTDVSNSWAQIKADLEKRRSENLEKAQLEHSDRVLWVHKRNETCDGGCAIHNPTDHWMRSFPQHWRDDRGLMERICPHGTGHPDPDDLAFKRRTKGVNFARTEAVHGCDGCCSPGGYERVQSRWQHQCAGCRNESVGTLDDEGLCETCTTCTCGNMCDSYDFEPCPVAGHSE